MGISKLMKTIIYTIFLIFIFSCNSNNYKVTDVSTSQIILNNTEIEEYKKNYDNQNGKYYSDSLNQYFLLESKGFKAELKAVNIYDEKWFTETRYCLKIYNESEIYFEKEIENYEPVSLTKETKNCEVVMNKNFAYILYVNGNGEKDIKQNLNLIVIDLKKKQTIYEKSIIQQDYGISNLTASLDLECENLLIAYSDISKQNSKGLTYAVFNLKNLTFSKKPKSIFQFDKWEKRNPVFISYNNQTYLFNTTGDEYGFFSYKGKSGMAISTISDNHEPENYVSFFDNGQIFNMIIMNGYFYYKLAVENQRNEIIKKLKLTELQ